MTISIKSNPDGVSGAIQVNGVDKVTINSSGQVAATSFSASGAVVAASFSGDGSALTGITTLPTQTGNSGKYLTTNGTAASWGTLDFTSSLSTSGYQKLPSGLIIQWGTTALISTDALLSVTFPIAFPNAPLSITGSGVASQISGGATQTGFNFPTLSTTGFTVANDTTQNSIRWIAIGY